MQSVVWCGVVWSCTPYCCKKGRKKICALTVHVDVHVRLQSTATTICLLGFDFWCVEAPCNVYA